jgi:hypothetical protein
MDCGAHMLIETAGASFCGSTTQPVDSTRFLMVTVSFWYAREPPPLDWTVRGLGEIFNTRVCVLGVASLCSVSS